MNRDAFEIDEKLQQLKNQYKQNLLSTFEELNNLTAKLTEDHSDNEVVKQLYAIYHRLAGTAGSFGFLALSAESFKLDRLCKHYLEKDVNKMPVETVEAIRIGTKQLKELVELD